MITDITLGGLTLNDDLIWVDRFTYSPIAQSTDRLLAGTLVVHNQTLQKGQPITLEANESTGWFTTPMVTQIMTWAATPGQELTFNFHNEVSYQVAFNHEDAPAVEFNPIVFRVPYATTDYFTGTLKLFTV